MLAARHHDDDDVCVRMCAYLCVRVRVCARACTNVLIFCIDLRFDLSQIQTY